MTKIKHKNGRIRQKDVCKMKDNERCKSKFPLLVTGSSPQVHRGLERFKPIINQFGLPFQILGPKIAYHNCLYAMLRYPLNTHPTLWKIWGLVMQHTSSHVFVFSVIRIAALICQACSERFLDFFLPALMRCVTVCSSDAVVPVA